MTREMGDGGARTRDAAGRVREGGGRDEVKRLSIGQKSSA